MTTSTSLTPDLSLALLNLMLHTTFPLLLGVLIAHRLRSRAALSTLLHRAMLLAVTAVIVASLATTFWNTMASRSRSSLTSLSSSPLRRDIPQAPTIFQSDAVADESSVEALSIAQPSTTLVTSEAGTKTAPIRPQAVASSPPAQPSARAAWRVQSKYFGGLFWLCGLWLAGAGALLAHLAACYFTLWQWRKSGCVLRDGAAWEWVQHECAQRKIEPPQLISSERVVNPFLGGVCRPAIFLPTQWETIFDEDALRAVLQHELAHYERGDTRWLLWAQLLRALLWLQPLSWLFARSVERNSEDACDNEVLQSRCAPDLYARCLLDVAQRLQHQSCAAQAERAAGIGVLRRRSDLERRIVQILQGARPCEKVTMRMRVAASTFLMVVVVLSMRVILEAAPETPKAAESRTRQNATAQIVLPTQPLNRSTPRATVESFLRAIQNRDVPMLAACVRNANAPGDLSPLALHLPTQSTLAGRVTVMRSGDQATVTAPIKMRYRMVNAIRQPQNAILQLQRVGNIWLITRDNRSWRERRDDPLSWFVRHIADPNLGKIKRWARGRGSASMTGKVIYEDGRPASGVSVSINVNTSTRDTIPGYASGPEWIMPHLLPPPVRPLLSQQVTTAPDGTYRATGLTTTKYRVTVSVPGGASLRGSSPPPDWAAPPAPLVRVSEGREAKAPDMVLTRGALIEVRVVDARTSQGLATVFLFGGPRRHSSGAEHGAKTDAHGKAVLRVPEGEVRVSVGGEMAQSQGGAFITRTPRGVYALSRNARAQLEDKPPVPFQGQTYLKVEKDTTRRLTIRLQPYVATAFKPRALALPPPRLKVPESGKGRGILIGRVVDESGRPVANVRVQAKMQQTARWDFFRRLGLAYGHFNEPKEAAIWKKTHGLFASRALSRADGTWELRGLATAPYNLTTADPGERGTWPNRGEVQGLISPSALGVWARDGQTIRRQQPIVLQRGALIRGRVVDKATGEGLGGVYVACYGPHRPRSSDEVASVASGRDGGFALRVAPGQNQIYVAGPALNEYSGNSVYVDTGARNNAYAIKTQRGPYAGSNGFDYVVDGGAPRTIVGHKQQLVLDLKAGQSPLLELRLRRLRLQPRDEYEE